MWPSHKAAAALYASLVYYVCLFLILMCVSTLHAPPDPSQASRFIERGGP